jgi:hypothetical protein
MRSSASNTSGASELAILRRVLEATQPPFSLAAARGILTMGFSQADKDRMRELSQKAQQGTRSRAEQDETNNYERVGHLLSLMKAKARRSLKGRPGLAASTRPV